MVSAMKYAVNRLPSACLPAETEICDYTLDTLDKPDSAISVEYYNQVSCFDFKLSSFRLWQRCMGFLMLSLM